MEERRLGNIYGFDGGNYAGNVYDGEGLAPTIRTFQGGGQQPMIIQEVRQIGNLTENAKRNNPNRRRVCDNSGLAPTLTSGMGEGGNLQPFTTVAMRGRNPGNPSDRTAGIPARQRLEPDSQGICNTLTSVQKDNMVLEKTVAKTKEMKIAQGNIVGTLTTDSCTSASHNGSYGAVDGYRIRKLTPLECWRLMGFTDEDFHKAEKTNSNSQLYKQAGNSIVKDVLMAILKQMMPEGDIGGTKKSG